MLNETDRLIDQFQSEYVPYAYDSNFEYLSIVLNKYAHQ